MCVVVAGTQMSRTAPAFIYLLCTYGLMSNWCNKYLFCSQSKKRSGVEGLIEIENPNRVSQKSKKVTEIEINAPRELSRRER